MDISQPSAHCSSKQLFHKRVLLMPSPKTNMKHIQNYTNVNLYVHRTIMYDQMYINQKSFPRPNRCFSNTTQTRDAGIEPGFGVAQYFLMTRRMAMMVRVSSRFGASLHVTASQQDILNLIIFFLPRTGS